MPTFDPSDLIGRTFLLQPEENGERHRAKVTRQVVEIIDQDSWLLKWQRQACFGSTGCLRETVLGTS